MVLAELGGKLRESLRKLHASSASGLDSRVLDTLLSEISRALIESDVNVKLVMTLRNNIKNRVGESLRVHEESGGGTSSAQNIVKLVQKSVTEELIALLSPENVKPYVMKKNKSNIILFVGLQGAGVYATMYLTTFRAYDFYLKHVPVQLSFKEKLLPLQSTQTIINVEALRWLWYAQILSGELKVDLGTWDGMINE